MSQSMKASEDVNVLLGQDFEKLKNVRFVDPFANSYQLIGLS